MFNQPYIPFQPGYPSFPASNNGANHQGSNQSNFVQVYNRQSVDQYYVAPNSQVVFVYENEPIIAIKDADAAGVTVVKEYDLVPHQQTPAPSYVTKEEFQLLVDRVNYYESITQQPTIQQPSQPIQPIQPTEPNQQPQLNA